VTRTEAPDRAERRITVTDVLFLAIILVFFAVAVLFVHACERIVGPDLEGDAPAETTEPEQVAA
jgi:hypothetical protein